MGKKKRGYPDVEDVLARPWCYYCERDFDDLKILISHQKAKHFKCDKCGRRLNTAGGLSVHLNQVHKEQLTAVENALPNRQGLEVEIFGMEGIPDDIMQTHNQRVLQQFYEAQAERRAKSGNLADGESAKKRKIVSETPEELKKRLAEWKLKKSDPNWIPPSLGTPNQDVQSPATAVNSNSPVPVIPSPLSALPHQLPPFAQPLMHAFPSYPPGMPTPPFQTGAPPGLPQRPVFGAPPGQHAHGAPALPDAIDDLIASVSQGGPPAAAEAEKKAPKVGKNARLVYGDNDVSPEEKMAGLARYAFVR